MSKSGWGAIIRGEADDLEDWKCILKQHFDPWVEMHENDIVLRSRWLDELSSAEEVRCQAVSQIEQLNGAMALSQGTRLIQLGGVVEFTPDGRRHTTIFLEPASLTLRGARVGVAVLTVDGKPPPEPAREPSDVQNWMALADNDDLLEDALIYFGRANNWFDIYKTIECLILRFAGGNESTFFRLSWAPEVELLKRTANWARHARRRYNPPKNPMPFEKAHQLTAELLRRAFAEAGQGHQP